MKNENLTEIAEGMSRVATDEPWYGVFYPPLSEDGPQVDQLWAVFRDPDSAQDYLDEKPKRRGGYVLPVDATGIEAYRVPGSGPA